MNHELIARLAREAGFVDYELDDGTPVAFDVRYARFAALVAEECAKVSALESVVMQTRDMTRGALRCAVVIRALFTTAPPEPRT
jgi:hypothetical protein